MAKIRRYDEIMESAVSNMIAKQKKITDFNEGSVIHTILDTVSRIAERDYVAIRQGFNELLAILPYSLFGMEKKKGMYANGTVVFSRNSELSTSSVIAKGTKVSDGEHFFVTTEAGNIAAGALESDAIAVVAENSGKEYNLATGSINSIESIVPADVISVTNNKAFTGGTDIETDAELEARFKNFINGLSGTNEYAIKNAALAVNEVRSVSVQNHKPPYKNIYNMSIYVDDGSGGASEETIAAVKLAVEGDDTAENQGHLVPGVNIRVLAPTAIPVNIAANIYVYTTDIEEARSEIEKIISSYINSLAIGKPCIVSELVTKIMALNYVKDVSITSPSSNITPGIFQIARVGEIQLSISEVE